MYRAITSDHAMIAYATCAVALVAALPALRQRRWGQAVRVASAVLLAGGILTVLSTTLTGTSAPTARINLVPGASIRGIFTADYRNALENTVGNIALFLPLGFFATILTGRRVGRVTLVAAAFSVFIETTQLVLGERWVDIDDVLLNTTGAFLGALAAVTALRLVAERNPDASRPRQGEPLRDP